MDKTMLVKSDLKIEGLVLEALSRAKIPVTLCDWNYAPELEEGELIIVTPWYDTKGPREVYSRLIDALEAAGTYQDVPMQRVFLKSPDDPLVKELEHDLRARTEGTIHIVGQAPPYMVVFGPYSARRGALPAKRLSALEDLRDFLDRRLHIEPTRVEEALAEIARMGRASIPNVRLTPRQAKGLGLA